MISCVRYILLMVALLSSQWCVADERSPYTFRGEILKGYDEETVKSRCDAGDLHPIEGVWYYPDEKITLVIERCESGVNNVLYDYRLVLVDSEDMSLYPGTVIGYCTPTVDSDKFKLWIYCEQHESVLENPQMCVASLNNTADELVIERSEVKMKVRVNFSRFLPKLLKGVSVVPSKKEVKAPEGFKKVYPQNSKIGVRYL